MTYTSQHLPDNYESYNSLTACSNTIIGGGHLASLGEVIPLIIGKGKKPKIWLQALTNSESKEFQSIIEESVSQSPAVRIEDTLGSINIFVNGIQILRVKESSENSVVIDYLNLAPIGFNIQGSAEALSIGNSVLSGNQMHGGLALIGFS
jgi:hypothetical protein